MNAMSRGSAYPRTPYLLALIGGILIILDALAAIAEGILDRAALNSYVPGAAGLVAALGAIGLIAGLVVLVGALRLKSSPQSAKKWGVLILVFSLVSFVGGGGAIIGLILGLIGGIMAITWVPPVVPGVAYGSPAYGTPSNQPIGSSPWGTSASPPTAGAPVQRYCSSCGSPNVSSARFCAKCGAPMS
jgi:hypothetical protein